MKKQCFLLNLILSTKLITSPVSVTDGGTGLTNITEYSLLAGGTTNVGALQSLDTGNPGEILSSTGPGSIPAWIPNPLRDFQRTSAYVQLLGTTASYVLAQSDTTPTFSSGTGYTIFTTNSITPQSDTSTFKITVVIHGNIFGTISVGIFDSTQDAAIYAAPILRNVNDNSASCTLVAQYIGTSGSTTARTFTIRIYLGSAGTIFRINAQNQTTARAFGGVCWSTVAVEEYP